MRSSHLHLNEIKIKMQTQSQAEFVIQSGDEWKNLQKHKFRIWFLTNFQIMYGKHVKSNIKHRKFFLNKPQFWRVQKAIWMPNVHVYLWHFHSNNNHERAEKKIWEKHNFETVYCTHISSFNGKNLSLFSGYCFTFVCICFFFVAEQ